MYPFENFGNVNRMFGIPRVNHATLCHRHVAVSTLSRAQTTGPQPADKRACPFDSMLTGHKPRIWGMSNGAHDLRER